MTRNDTEENFFPAIADGINEKRDVPIIDMRSSDTIFESLSFFERCVAMHSKQKKSRIFAKFDENQRMMPYE